MLTEHNLQVNLITACFPLAFHCYSSPHPHSNSSASFPPSFIRILLIILLLPQFFFFPSLPVSVFLRPQFSSLSFFITPFFTAFLSSSPLLSSHLHCLPLIFSTAFLSSSSQLFFSLHLLIFNLFCLSEWTLDCVVICACVRAWVHLKP